MSKLNPAWTKEMIGKLDNRDIPFDPVILDYNPAAKWLIAAMARRGLKAKVENLGAGVKRISIAGTCCKLCGRKE